MSSESTIRIFVLVALLSVCFAVRKTDRVSHDYDSYNQDVSIIPEMKGDLNDLPQKQYISLLQTSGTNDSNDTPASVSDESSSTTASSTEEVEDPDPENLLFGDRDILDYFEPKSNNRQYLTMAFLIGIFALILFIILVRRLTERSLNEILITRLNSIMKRYYHHNHNSHPHALFGIHGRV